MSTGGPPDGPDPGDDPFAFPEDERDRRSDRAPDRPAEEPAPGAAPDDPAPREDPGVQERSEAARQARVRAAAEEASQRAQQIGLRWLIVAAAIFLVVVGITTLGGGGRDSSSGDVEPGSRLPDFAAPLATRPKLEDDDVNLASRDGQGEAGRRAACSIVNPSVVTSCALLRRGPLVLVAYSGGVNSCVQVVDDLNRLRGRYPRLSTLAVQTLGTHGSSSDIVADRRWTLPVVYDRDQGLSTRLGVPVCPVVLFVRQDGTVRQRLVGRVSTEELERGMRALDADRARPGAGTTTVDAPAPGQ